MLTWGLDSRGTYLELALFKCMYSFVVSILYSKFDNLNPKLTKFRVSSHDAFSDPKYVIPVSGIADSGAW